MVKRAEMLKQLKRSDKRRARRPVTEFCQTFPPSVQRQLLSVLSQRILEFSKCNTQLTDSQIIEVLRGSLTNRDCSDVLAADLQSRLQQLMPTDRSGEQDWRRALQTLLADVEGIARGARDPRSFISYLQVIAS